MPPDSLLPAASQRDLLRLITCGSVDDGKSTLIGRLLYDTETVPDDLLASAAASATQAQGAGVPDLAMLVDGLQAEREQGITIDVGYRYFTTPRRRFILADTPGHEQYTRNMATGASNAQLAIILVDARKGLLRQTHRHTAIVALMGIRNVVLAVNKMDLVDYARQRFEEIVAAYEPTAARLGLQAVTAIPMSALNGDNVVVRGRSMPWYEGPTLLQHLEEVPAASPAGSFRFNVQWVNRSGQDFRAYAGTVLGGSIRPGDEVAVYPSGVRTTVSGIVTFEGALDEATAGQAVNLTLAEAVDVGRGDVIATTNPPPHVSDRFGADLVWMDDAPLLPGRPYLMRLGGATLTARVAELTHRLDIATGDPEPADRLGMNDIGLASIALDRPAAFDVYDENRDTGSFILIDRITNATVGAGMIRFPLQRTSELRWQKFTVDKGVRASLKGQRPAVLWFTGLSGSGKSTVADGVERRLAALGRHTYTLDGDNVRHGLNRDLGFGDADRIENIRRVIETARLMADAGLIVLVSFISPFRADRQLARERLGGDEFLEIFVDTPIAECERRDPKGLYRKARAGELANFTGIDSAYEPPAHAELHLRTTEMSVEQEVEAILREMHARRIIDRLD